MKAILQLGRVGDILNILPLAHKTWRKIGEKPGFIIAQEYSDILDGVSYVEPLIWEGNWTDVQGATNMFHEYDILTAQIYGHGVMHTPQTDSFCKDSWLSTGSEYDPYAHLVFDRCDIKRENELIEEHIKEGTNILINLGGNSSPFANDEQVMNLLHSGIGLVTNMIDLSAIRAHRIYDLLGLYDVADLLITTDTATLHLVQASDIPSIQFIVDTPTLWHGSPPKGHCVLDIRYSDVLKRMTEIHSAVYKLLYV
jgi:hypothetical protein